MIPKKIDANASPTAKPSVAKAKPTRAIVVEPKSAIAS